MSVEDANSIVLAANGPLAKLHGQLQMACKWMRAGSAATAATKQAGIAPSLMRGDDVLVEIYYAASDSAALASAAAGVDAALRDAGAQAVNRLGGAAVVAWVPMSKLESLAADKNIARISLARRARHTATTSEAVVKTNADWWQSASFNGSGITVALIDSYDDTSGNIAALQGSGDWPTSVTLHDFKNMAGCTGFGCAAVTHGDATMELTFDIAPLATFHAYDTWLVSDWYNAILDAANLDANGAPLGSPKANVISASLGAPLDSIGDGTAIPGSIAEAAGFARANGVLVVNAAGNAGGSHWSGNGNIALAGADINYHQWSGTNTYNNIFTGYCVPAGFDIVLSLSWNDWATSGGQFVSSKDYALELYYKSGTNTFTQVASSDFAQSGAPGDTPQEYVAYTTVNGNGNGCPANTRQYFSRIRRKTAGAANYFQFFDEVGYGLLQFQTLPSSLGYPADSPNVLTVGAIDQTTPTVIESFSSRGPVLGAGGGAPSGSPATDPNLKPDLTQFDNVTTVSYGAVIDNNGFFGTSAATPLAAGVAALFMQRFGAPADAAGVDAIKQKLQKIASIGANDLGTAGKDYNFGYGRLMLQKETAVTFETQPSNTAAGQTITPNVRLAVRDAANLIVPYGIFDHLNLVFGNDPSAGTATLAGPAAPIANDGSGIATFTTTSIDKPGIAYTLKSSAGVLPAATSNAFNITIGAAAKLAFTVQPQNGTAGSPLAAIQVSVEDSVGNVVTSDNSTQVSLALANNPGDAMLSGGAPVAVVNGVATFNAVALDKVGVGYTLTAGSGNLAAAVSSAFTIAPGAAAKLVFGQQPTNGTAGVALSPAVTVRVLDANDNLVTSSNAAITLTLANNPGGALLTGGNAAASGGIATFAGVSLNKVGVGYTLNANAAGLAGAVSNAFSIAPGAAAKLAFTVQPSSVLRGTHLGAVTAAVQDVFGNTVASDNATQVQFTIAACGGSVSLGGGVVQNGLFTLPAGSGPIFYTLATGLHVNAADMGSVLTSAQSAGFDVTANSDIAFADGFELCRL